MKILATSLTNRISFILLTTACISIAAISYSFAQAGALSEKRFNSEAVLSDQAAKHLAVAMHLLENTSKLRIMFENASGHPVSIRIKDASNRLYYQENRIFHTKYIRKLDLGQLRDGIYTVVVFYRNEVYKEVIHIQSSISRDLQTIPAAKSHWTTRKLSVQAVQAEPF